MTLMIVAAFVYIGLPWYIQSAVWLVNLFIPDPIPFLDELIMFVPIAYKVKRIFDVSEFLRKYGKVLAAFLGIGIIALIIFMIIYRGRGI